MGKILARKLGREFVEMDERIETSQERKISDIFKDQGEARFRQLESELLVELSKKEDLVVSCGGGLICSSHNLEILKKGLTFCLESSSEAIYKRTKAHGHRPLLNVEKPLEAIEELLKKRAPFYSQADHAIKSEEETPEQVADKIIAILK